MVSRRRLFTLLVLLLTASLFLVACERPTPGREDTEAVPDSETETTDPNVGGGVDNGYPAEEPEEPADSEQPPDTEEPPDETADAGDTGDTAEEPQDTTEEPGDEEPDTDTEEPAETDAGDDAADEIGGGVPDDTGDQDVGGGTPDAGADDAAATQPTAEIRHVVQPGENLYRIGLKYGISWITLADYNRITFPHRIDVGQVVRIPGSDTGGQPAPTPTPLTHVVRPGENLFRIGLQYGVSWTQIAEANGLINPNQIYVGQALKIPTSVPGPTPPFTHVVRPGENLFRISLQYGLPWPTIAAENSIPSPYIIYVGQPLRIPGG